MKHSHRPRACQPTPQPHRDFLLHGHLPGSGVQAHSAGGLFPYVTYVQTVDGALVHGFIAPGQNGILVGSYDAAHDACLRAKTAHAEGLTLREAALKLKLVTDKQFTDWIKPELMTKPGL